MAFQIGSNERPGNGLRRVALEELARAILKIESGRQEVEFLHDLRKQLKKLRALLRLAGEKPPCPGQKRLSAIYRGASRQIAGMRDAQVQTRALEKLGKCCREPASRELCHILQARMAARTLRTAAVLPLRTICANLKKASKLHEKWPPGELSWRAVRKSWRKTGRKNFKLMRRACANPGTENFHEWRKSVKTWWYQTLLLKFHCDEPPEKLLQNLETLGEWLGEDHDLALVEQTLLKTKSAVAPVLKTVINKQRARLQKRAVKLGSKLAQKFRN